MCLGLLLILCAAAPSLACQCAPLASCVVFANGSWGCVCPFWGDGYNVCEEQRFVTDVVVRSRSPDIQPWLLQYQGAKVGSLVQRRLLADTQYVLELDSTNYDAMQALTAQINNKSWSYSVALLGSATSRIVRSQQFDERPPLLEVLNVTYNATFWEIEFVASDGLIFVAGDESPLPCIHVPGACCARDYGYVPFRVGSLDYPEVMECRLPTTNRSQYLGYGNFKYSSHIVVRDDGSFLLRIKEEELSSLATVDANSSNFSVGVLDASLAATQVFISLQRRTQGYALGNFTRQVAPFVMAQVEQVGNLTFARLWAQVLLPNATIVASQHAYEAMEWDSFNCVVAQAALACMPPMPPPCTGTVRDGMLEAWFPLRSSHSVSRGNLSLYLVVQQGSTLARIMTQTSPQVAVRHCTEITVAAAVDLQVLQGLSLRQIYRGPVLPYVPLQVEPQTDTLITLVARSTRGAAIAELRAVHARTDAERQLVASNAPCPTCVHEQLVLNSKVSSPRSCFVFGSGDPAAWIQGYVGLVGSSLAMDVLAKVPGDVKAGSAAAAWVNPVWPYATDEELNATTYLYVRFGNAPTVQGPVLRRLLGMDSSADATSEAPKHSGMRAQWLVIATTAFIVLIWHIYQILVFFK